jgi:GT2 family glycosyltransferase
MFDIIVPTYNRYDALSIFFKKLAFLDKTQYTLWIIDDCSPDKNIAVIPTWDNIKYIQLPQNIGQAGARNYAIEHGTAPYIISLDDDAWFMADSPNFDLIVKTFKVYPHTGCLMFNIATPKTDFESDIDGKTLPVHVTCGCAYRRQALEEIKGFNSMIQGQSEESDISLKLYRTGWDIRSLYSVHVFHDFNPGERSEDWHIRIRYKETRNCLVVAYINYPTAALIWALPGKALNQLLFAIKAKIAIGKTFIAELKAIAEFISMIPKLKPLRNPLSMKQFKEWRSLFKNLKKCN